MTLRVMVSRHSAFYSPVITAVELLRERGVEVEYSIAKPGQRSAQLLGSGEIDIMQSAVSSNWKPMERGESPLPVHFAQINRRDGFFLVGRRPDAAFEGKSLEGRRLLADHAFQPMAMLRYAGMVNGLDWSRVHLIDARGPESMEHAFREGEGDYVHLQSPAAHSLERDGVGWVARSVGASMPEVAFSSLCCSSAFIGSHRYDAFMSAYREARGWVRTAAPLEAARREADFFPSARIDAIAGAIAAYQSIGCWGGDVGIPRDLYEQALTVFDSGGLIARRHPYEEVCMEPS